MSVADANPYTAVAGAALGAIGQAAQGGPSSSKGSADSSTGAIGFGNFSFGGSTSSGGQEVVDSRGRSETQEDQANGNSQIGVGLPFQTAYTASHQTNFAGQQYGGGGIGGSALASNPIVLAALGGVVLVAALSRKRG